MSLEYGFKGFAEFEAAVRRNPTVVISRGNVFLTRALAAYRGVIWRNPWPMARYFTSGGGGAPVDTGNLRDTHNQTISMLEGRIYPTASYARFVHDGTRFLHKRPWLEYAFEKADPDVRKHEEELARDIVDALAA